MTELIHFEMKVEFFNPIFLHKHTINILKLLVYITKYPELCNINQFTRQQVRRLFLALELKGYNRENYEFDKHGRRLLDFMKSIPNADNLASFAEYGFRLLPVVCYITKLRL